MQADVAPIGPFVDGAPGVWEEHMWRSEIGYAPTSYNRYQLSEAANTGSHLTARSDWVQFGDRFGYIEPSPIFR